MVRLSVLSYFRGSHTAVEDAVFVDCRDTSGNKDDDVGDGADENDATTTLVDGNTVCIWVTSPSLDPSWTRVFLLWRFDMPRAPRDLPPHRPPS